MMKKIKFIGLFAIAFLVGCASGPDRTAILEQHVMNAENRIALLETEISKERESIDEDEQSLRAQFAKIRVELDRLTSDVQELTGRLEEVEFMLRQELEAQDLKRSRVTEDLGSNTNRIARLEEYLNLEPHETKEAGDTNTDLDKKEPVKEISEEQLYTLAKQAFDQQDLERARSEFEKFIKRYPKSENADNAQFWIGEIYYREKWYEKSHFRIPKSH